MWWMLKDVRSIVKELVTKVNGLELKIASDDSRIKILHIDEKLKETRTEAKIDIKELNDRVLIVEKQMPHLWSKVGDRPEDIQKRREVR